ncbi:MAG: helix-turn-helix domain-containing protein [Acidimicrobiales bacterium]|nr:helix-turn-helix domain-containing protein [Acidimicrobiales bacterium]
MSDGTPGNEDGRASWTFLTNHAHVLLCIAEDPGARLRDVATRVGITERAAQSIVADLVATGYLTRERVGRRNHYEIHPARPLRHPIERHHDVGELLALLTAETTTGR